MIGTFSKTADQTPQKIKELSVMGVYGICITDIINTKPFLWFRVL